MMTQRMIEILKAIIDEFINTAEPVASKGFYDLHLKTRLEGSYNYSKGEQYSSGKAISYTADNYTVKPSIDFSPSWCAFSYEGEFSFYNSKRQKMAKSSLFNWRQSIDSPIDEFEGYNVPKYDLNLAKAKTYDNPYWIHFGTL